MVSSVLESLATLILTSNVSPSLLCSLTQLSSASLAPLVDIVVTEIADVAK